MKKCYQDRDFLFDNKFISWRLLRTEEQNLYWERFTEERPECREALEKAIRKFNAIKFNRFDLTEQVQENLYQKILADVHRRMLRRRRLIYWSAAASIALLLSSYLMFFQLRFQQTRHDEPNIEAIVGQVMPGNDIHLISGKNTVALKQDALITLKNGCVSVKEDNKNNGNNNNSKVAEITLSENVMNRLVVPAGKRSTLQLPDGTNIWLNSGTELDFPSKFEGRTREISLKGEIYIEVAKELRPFFVNTSQFKVQVYGTKFNISAYGGKEENAVVLVEGSVKVTTANASGLLTPNQKATVNADNIRMETVNVNEYISWKDGLLIFNQTTISDVLKKIGRYYNINFEDRSENKLSTRTCTGKLFLSDNLEEVMISISSLSSTSYSKENDTMYLINNNQPKKEEGDMKE